MNIDPLALWHRIVQSRQPRELEALLADDVVFHSPVVHTPQLGKAITTQYLAAALRVFGEDMLRWDDAGRVVEFKVMLRPLKAVNLIHQKMAAMLQERKA
jgi:hypothetical protein